MRILVFMSDNRDLSGKQASFIPISASINYNYCQKHGYDFVYFQTYFKNPDEITLLNCMHYKTNQMRHASWSKLISTVKAMNYVGYDYIVYIDTDCIFKNQSKTLEEIINSTNKDIIFFTDAPWHVGYPCAGFYICKINEHVRQYIKDWYNYDVPDRNTGHPWEQYGLWMMKRFDEFHIVEDSQFVENDWQFLRHIHGAKDTVQEREPYFKKFAEKNNIPVDISNIKVIKYDTNNFKSYFQ